jgi:hypothetical protein
VIFFCRVIDGVGSMPLEVVLASVKILFPSGHNFNINCCNIII